MPHQMNLFDAAGLGIVMLGPDCLIRNANRAMTTLSGWSQAELSGQKACSELLLAPYGDPYGCAGFCRAPDLTTGPTEEDMVPALLRHKSGPLIPVLVSVAPLGADEGFALLMWDVTERVRLAEETDLRRRQSAGLREIAREIAACPDLKQNLDTILDRARNMFSMDLVAWGMLDETTGHLTWESARGTGGAKLRGASLPLDGSIMGRVLLTGRPFVTQNLAGQSGEAGRELFGVPLLTAMAVPMQVSENTLSVLLCASTEAIALTEEDVVFLSYLSSHLTAALENGQLMEQLKRVATLEERHRLAREMHDSFGQTLTYLGLRNQIITQLAARGDTDAILRETAMLKQVIQEAHTEVRRSIFGLKASGQPETTLAERWRRILADFEERTGIRTELSWEEAMPETLPEQVHLHLTRILQESLANIRNHSGAVTVAVRVAVKQGELHLTVTDDGCGFDADRVHGPDQHHFGLSIMRERSAAVGAHIEIRSMRGHGTTVAVRIPLTRGD